MSKDDDDEERLVAEIPEELKRLVDADERTNKEVVKAALWREFGGERKGALERRVEEKENRISMLKRERNERNREIEEAQEDLARLKTRLKEQRSEKTREIDAVIDDMVDANATMATDAPRIDRIAREYFNGDVETCVAAISDRKDERDIEQAVIR